MIQNYITMEREIGSAFKCFILTHILMLKEAYIRLVILCKTTTGTQDNIIPGLVNVLV